jgi:copper chaperone
MAINDISLTSRDLLGTSSPDAGGCCGGGGGCMCGSGTASSTDAVSSQEFRVTGMTCGHCVSSVREEVRAIAGVRDVEVVLKKGGESRVTVSAASPVDRDAVRAAIDEAGYQLV